MEQGIWEDRPAYRCFAAAAFVLTAFIMLGCMSFSLGGRTYQTHNYDTHCENGICSEEGKTCLKSGSVQDIYYPFPYAHTPNLEITNHHDECVIVEQKEDHFRLSNQGPHMIHVHWHARGVRVVAPTAPPPTGPPPSTPPISPSGPSLSTPPISPAGTPSAATD